VFLLVHVLEINKFIYSIFYMKLLNQFVNLQYKLGVGKFNIPNGISNFVDSVHYGTYINKKHCTVSCDTYLTLNKRS
jgi:hypothetical protein